MNRRDFTRTFIGAGLTGTALLLPVPGYGNLERERDRLFAGCRTAGRTRTA